MPVQGQVRLRAHQFGRQSAFGTPVAAKRRYPFSGVPDVNLNWTDPEIDEGALDPVAPPYRQAPAPVASLTAPALCYNDLPLMLLGILGMDGSTPITPTGGGAAKTWAITPASLTADQIDPFVYEFGDDVTTDWFQLSDGYETQLVINTPEQGGGVISASMQWAFGQAASTGSSDSPVTGTVPTPGLSLDIASTPIYLKDCSVYIDSVAASGGDTQITDAVHNFTLTINQAIDEKRYANGTQSFAADALGRGARTIELALQYAKTSDTVGTGSESDAWFSDTATNRFVEIVFESVAEAEGGTPYSWSFALPARYFTRAETNIGGNTTVTLTAHAFYDATATYAFTTEVVNTLASANF